jgi:hypothetical protein
MPRYSYDRSLEHSYRINWRIEDVLGAKRFDPSRRWLPDSLSGVAGVSTLGEGERRSLTHVEMAAYAHLFGYVEEFIAPKVLSLAQDFEIEQRVAFDALTNFAAEEVKHMNLFRRVGERVDAALGFEAARIGAQAETARFVLGKSSGAVLLLMAAIEWLTLRHYVEAFKEDDTLDPLTRDIFHAHWLEESQHAQLDHLETVRAFAAMDERERERAVDELLQAQTDHDLANFQTSIGRLLGPAERVEVRKAVLGAKRWTFIESGVTHPRFQELLVEVTTPTQRARIGAALEGLLATSAAA